MTKYQYDGVLTRDEASWSSGLLQQYPYAVEAQDEIKTQVLEWIKSNVEEVQGVGEGCMGEDYIKTYQPWAMFGRGKTTMFFLFKQSYADALKEKFGDKINIKPFKTEF